LRYTTVETFISLLASDCVYYSTLSCFEVLAMLREMLKLKQLLPRSLLSKLKWKWRKKASMKPTETSSIARPHMRPTKALPVTRSAAPGFNARLTEASTGTRHTVLLGRWRSSISRKNLLGSISEAIRGTNRRRRTEGSVGIYSAESYERGSPDR
jgi:hypothetical protein